jgi:hypothetical protein
MIQPSGAAELARLTFLAKNVLPVQWPSLLAVPLVLNSSWLAALSLAPTGMLRSNPGLALQLITKPVTAPASAFITTSSGKWSPALAAMVMTIQSNLSGGSYNVSISLRYEPSGAQVAHPIIR